MTCLEQLLEEYREQKQFPLQEKQYWTFLDTQNELQYSKFYYFPEAHYNQAISKTLEQEFDSLPDQQYKGDPHNY